MYVVADGRSLDLIEIASEVDRLQRLAMDLMLFADGHLNAGERIPLLDNWVPAIKERYCLAGEVTGHPTLPGSARQIVTSELYIMAETAGYARTSSRWYRLGRPLGAKPSS